MEIRKYCNRFKNNVLKKLLCFVLFQFEANFHNWDVFSTDNYNIIMCDDILLQKMQREDY